MPQGTKVRTGIIVGLLVGMVALAGCSGGLLGGGGTPPAADQVPENVTTVMHVDMAILDDQTTRTIAETGAEDAPAVGAGQPENISETQERFRNETGLDPNAAEEIVAFGKQSQSPALQSEYSGVIIHADWETQATVDTFRNDTDAEYEETTYNGQTVYRPVSESDFGRNEWFGVLGDGQFVTGTEAAVKDTIDVTAGDADSFDGSLRTAYDESRDGLVTVVATVPQEGIPESGGAGVDTGAYRDVETISGVYYTTSSSAGVEMQMYATGEDSARDVADVTDGAVSIATGYTENETTKDTLRAIEVTRDGSTVTVSFEESVDTLQEVIRYLNEA